MVNDKIKGAVYGVLIGDALGVPYEFKHKDLIPKWEDIELNPPDYFKRTYPNIKPGTWSDDSAQALCLLDSLVSCGKFDLKDFSDKLLRWLNEGLWAVDNRVFDCGVQTFSSLRAYERGMNERESGFMSPDGKGNGALMRVMPIAVFHHINNGEKDQIIRDAHEQCLITHGHVCNQVCCALYSLWAKYILEHVKIKEAYELSVSYLKEYYLKNSLEDYNYELEYILLEGNFSGGGYVVDSIRSVSYLLFKYEDYESVVKGAISLGNDTDTTAAIAGGLAGAYYGFSNIPQRFIDGLRGKKMLYKFNEVFGI